jgi:hypothetical protein
MVWRQPEVTLTHHDPGVCPALADVLLAGSLEATHPEHEMARSAAATCMATSCVFASSVSFWQALQHDE